MFQRFTITFCTFRKIPDEYLVRFNRIFFNKYERSKGVKKWTILSDIAIFKQVNICMLRQYGNNNFQAYWLDRDSQFNQFDKVFLDSF